MNKTNIIIKTVNSEFKAACNPEEFAQVIAAMEATGQKLFIHVPESIMPNTWLVKNQVVSVTLEGEKELEIGSGIIEVKKKK